MAGPSIGRGGQHDHPVAGRPSHRAVRRRCDTWLTLPGAPAGSFNGHGGRVAASSASNSSAPPQGSANGAHRNSSAAVPRVRHCPPVICSTVCFIAHGVYRPRHFGVASGPSSRRSSDRCCGRSCSTAVWSRLIDVRFGAHNGLKSEIVPCRFCTPRLTLTLPS